MECLACVPSRIAHPHPLAVVSAGPAGQAVCATVFPRKARSAARVDLLLLETRTHLCKEMGMHCDQSLSIVGVPAHPHHNDEYAREERPRGGSAQFPHPT